MKIREGQNYVVVGLQAFDSAIGSNCVNIAQQLAKDNQVLYVNFPFDQKSFLSQLRNPEPNTRIRLDVRRGISPELHKVGDNLHALYFKEMINSINWLPDGNLYDYFNLRNNKKIARIISKHLDDLGFKEFILFNDSDMFRSYYLMELLKPLLYVYYSRDNLISQDYFARHGIRLESELIRKSDVVTANSLYLTDYCRQFNSNSYYVGQGCSTDQFNPDSQYQRPHDLPHSSKPMIGYIGALLKLRLDIELLEFLAKSKPEWDFVFVGPEDEAFKNSHLHQLDNVFFTGPKKPEELPQYLSFFDVSINPQVVNEMTIGNYPRKIDEYLAMGKPTVATKTRAMEIFKDHVYLGESKEDYVDLIKKALSDNSPEREQERIEFAKNHTWEASVNAIYSAIEETLKKRDRVTQ